MGWLLGKLAGAAGPYIVGGVVVVLAGLGGWIGWLQWDNHSLRAEVAEAQQSTAEAQRDLAQCETDVGGLESAIQHQNERIARMRAMADRDAADARSRALSTLEHERERARRPPDGHGPAAMNDWLQRALAP
jgi:hypothetical protein